MSRNPQVSSSHTCSKIRERTLRNTVDRGGLVHVALDAQAEAGRDLSRGS